MQLYEAENIKAECYRIKQVKLAEKKQPAVKSGGGKKHTQNTQKSQY